MDQAFDASNLLRMMESLQSGTKKRVNILIVDACRNNDLPKSWRSTNNGLARMDAPAGSFISFATAPGQVASDGAGERSRTPDLLITNELLYQAKTSFADLR